MAFNKAFVVLSLLAVVLAAAIVDARLDVHQVSNEYDAQSLGWQKFCSSCECTKESKGTKCYRTDKKVGSCPVVCGSPCLCDRKQPPTCRCRYEVDTCNPRICSSVSADMFRAENLLIVTKD